MIFHKYNYTALIFYTIMAIILVFFIICIIRYYTSKGKYIKNKSEENKKRLVRDKNLLIASSIAQCIATILILFVFKQYILILILAIIYIIALMRCGSLYRNLDEKFDANKSNDIFIVVITSVLVMFCTLTVIFFIFIQYSLKDLYDDEINTVVKIATFISTPSENTKNEALDELTNLIDKNNNMLGKEYRIDSEKITGIRKSIDEIATSIISTNSQISKEKVYSAVKEGIDIFVASDSEITEEKVGDLIDSVINIFK